MTGSSVDNSKAEPSTTVQSLSATKESTNTKSSTQTAQLPATTVQTTAASVSSQPGQSQERVLITGDDILIEYVERLMNEIKNVDEPGLKQSWKT